MITASTTADSRKTVVLVNHTDKVRPEIDKLSRRLPQDEFEVVVVLPEQSRSTLDEYEGVTYRFYDAMFVPNIRYTIPTPSFYPLLEAELPDADVVHVIGYSYLPCLISVATAAKFGVQTVVTVDVFPGVSWSYGHRFVDLVAKTYTHTLGRLTFSLADRVVGLGEYIRDDLERFVDDPSKIEIVPNGIDTDRFSPGSELAATSSSSNPRKTTPSSGEGNVTQLLYVGRLDTVKGVPYLLDAFESLSNGSREYRLTIVGDGSRKADYEKQCRNLGIADAVSFEGWQSNVSPYYQSSDIFVLPSLSEGQPTVLMEAQASGLPVVSTDVGSARELVKAGRVVPKKDSAALSAAIEEVAKSDLTALAEQARRHIVANFSLDRMVEEYIRLYRDAAPKRPAAV